MSLGVDKEKRWRKTVTIGFVVCCYGYKAQGALVLKQGNKQSLYLFRAGAVREEQHRSVKETQWRKSNKWVADDER